MKKSRSSGVGSGQFLYTVNWPYALGTPSRRVAPGAEIVEGHAGQIQELCGAGLQIGEP